MTETPVSLLDRLRARPDGPSWRRLVELYTPFLRTTLASVGVQDADADDLTQDVFAALLRELPVFEHNGRTGAFRRWLRMMVVHRLQGYWRKRSIRAEAARKLDELADEASDLSKQWEREHDEHIARRLLRLLEPEFAPSTWQAFCRQVFDAASPNTVAADLGLTLNAVRIAKWRVLRRMREEMSGLTD